jgi:selenocysteine-specific elongation factor
MTNFILATAGHVDHGKSALVKALTGTDPDRLPEEKARGITIDLGFAELNLTGPNGEKFHVGIVDVPGHEDFVRNMIAGVGSIDLALLVVASDDGWMPQTEEHLQILSYLGVERVVVALTKCDLGKIDIVTSQIREKLNETTFANAQIIPTSVRTGDGLENLQSALSSELATLSPPRDIGKPRLFVDRAFTLHGIGTVVTGTLTGGQIQRGQNAVIQAQNISTRVRSIQSHGQDLEIARPGTRTAVNLPDLVPGSDVNRGDVIAPVGYEPTSTLDVLLIRSPRVPRSAAIKSGASAYVHHGTTRVLAKMIFAETDSLAVGQSAVAQLRLGVRLLAFVGDRLIVRDASEQHTIAGGVVFNIDSTDFRSTHQRALLASRTAAPDDVDLAVWTEIARSDVVETSHFLERSRFSETELATALQRLSKHGEIFLGDNVGAKMVVWRDLRKRAVTVVDTAHRAHPERRGLELNELRAELNSISPAAFDALLVDLCRDEFVRAGSTIATRSHRASLPPELKTPADQIRAALTVKPFDPPNRKDLLKNDRDQQALRFLIEQGEIVEVGEEIVLYKDSLNEMQATVSDFISANGAATAGQLREKLATSRRVIIPVLEYFDRKGVTRRVGDERVLAQKAAAATITDAANTQRT